ncbi:MAG TPA: chorismate mutase, partial [Jiangellales bacterium]|nr:chorismate mutase [Jiangellales bacterium]
GARLPVLGGPGPGADVVHLDLRRLHGRRDADEVLQEARAEVAAPLLVEPFSASDLAAVARHAAGVMVGAAWMQDFRLLAAVGRTGLPVVLQRGAHATVEEWLSSAEYVLAAGNGQVVLCESGSRTHLDARRTLDLALVQEVRDRTGMPVVVEVTGSPWLAGAAVASGADGLLLAEDASAADVATALEAATTLAPLVRRPAPATLPACREAIDRVDATLAGLLEYRAALATEVQRHKPVRGHAGRDRAREARIVHAMAHRAPSLGKVRLARVMDAVITAGLDAAEEQLPPEPPVWRL